MKDIKTDGKNLIFENGDLVLVDGKERVTQQIMVGLKIFKGDWFLDYRKGIDYVNGLKAYPNILKSEIKTAIQEVLDVQNVLDYTFKIDKQKYYVSAKVVVNNETVYLNGEYTL